MPNCAFSMTRQDVIDYANKTSHVSCSSPSHAAGNVVN